MAEHSMVINLFSSGVRSSRACVVLRKFPLWKTSNFHVDCVQRARSRCSIRRCSHLPAATYGKARGGQAFRTAYSSFCITLASRHIGSIAGITASRKAPRSAMHCCRPDARSRGGTLAVFPLTPPGAPRHEVVRRTPPQSSPPGAGLVSSYLSLREPPHRRRQGNQSPFVLERRKGKPNAPALSPGRT